MAVAVVVGPHLLEEVHFVVVARDQDDLLVVTLLVVQPGRVNTDKVELDKPKPKPTPKPSNDGDRS